MMNVHAFMILLVMAIIGICTLTPVNQIHLTMIAHGRKKVLLFECALVIKDDNNIWHTIDYKMANFGI